MIPLIILAIVVVAILAYFGLRSKPAAQTPAATDTTTTPSAVTPVPAVPTTPAAPAPITKLTITTTHEGTGPGVTAGQTISANYTGKLQNGTVFDSNVDPKFGHVQPLTFQVGVGMVIKGWDQGLLGMKVGEKRHIEIPADLAYGAGSPSPLIPASSALIFDVELLSIK